MAEFWGMLTLLTVTFAAARWMYSLPEAVVAVFIVAFPIRAIVDDLVFQMGRGGRKGQRLD